MSADDDRADEERAAAALLLRTHTEIDALLRAEASLRSAAHHLALPGLLLDASELRAMVNQAARLSRERFNLCSEADVSFVDLAK